MADTEKLNEALSYINLGLKLALGAVAEDRSMQGASTDELNARSEELHAKIKKMLDEDSANDRAEIERS